ncbi:MAG TPA: methyltransferase [Gemmataceae bacterium]|nr:methyltransferase [Gemmataceae bacterium]
MRSNQAPDGKLAEAWLPVLQAKARLPVCVALGSPRQAVELVETIPLDQPVLYQMDLHQADSTRQLLKERNFTATVATHADLWDLPSDFQTVIYPVESRGERMLKLDVIEQAFHILKPGGILIVLSRQESEQFFPAALKKIYGRFHIPDIADATLLWSLRTGDRPRRRHELIFQVSNPDGPSLRFVSRPGVFSYGRFDNGARALVETTIINPGDRILDLGCGCGTNGILCGLRGGAGSHVTFVDSNCRATTLAEMNATANGLTSFDVKTCSRLDGLAEKSFDIVLANPPYYANLSIAESFIASARAMLKPGGRLWLVTKQPHEIAKMLAERFVSTEAVERRGYVVMCATARI